MVIYEAFSKCRLTIILHLAKYIVHANMLCLLNNFKIQISFCAFSLLFFCEYFGAIGLSQGYAKRARHKIPGSLNGSIF